MAKKTNRGVYERYYKLLGIDITVAYNVIYIMQDISIEKRTSR